MKIVDVICEIPGLNIEGSLKKIPKGYSCTEYIAEENIALYQWVEKSCREILEKNSIDPNEIGIIINSSICLYETTSKGNTSAPGISHHIQKELMVTNAFVFELFHSDWGNMMQIASNFLLNTEQKYAIIMQTNKFNNTLKDYENGFSLPDGISIFLLEKTEGNITIENFPLPDYPYEKATFEFNKNNEHALQKEMLFKLNWNYNPTFIKAINKESKKIVQNAPENYDIITDQWFTEHHQNDSTRIKKAEFETLAMHSVPWYIQSNFSLMNPDKQVAIVSYNPFLSYYSVLKINNNEI